MIHATSIFTSVLLGLAPGPEAQAPPPSLDALHEQAVEHEARDAFLDAASVWTQISQRDDFPAEERQQAVYEAQGAYRLSYERTTDASALCRAWLLIDGYLSMRADEIKQREDLVAEYREYQRVIREQLASHRDASGSIPCPVILEKATDSAPAPMTASTAETPASEAPSKSAPAPASEPPPERPAEGPASAPAPTDASPHDDRARGRGLIISGGVAIALSAAALAISGYSTQRTITRRDELVALRELAESEMRGLTPEERASADLTYEEGKRAENLAIASGVVGGVVLITGATLIAVGARRRARGLAVQPALTPSLAGVSLTGRF